MLDSFKNHLVGQGKSQSTVQHYNSYLLDFLAWLDRELIEVENAGAKEVLGYLGHLKRKGLENKTRSIRLGVIRQYFDWQISQEKTHRQSGFAFKDSGSQRPEVVPYS